MKNEENDYLWDGSGEPDPEVQNLERLLGGLRYNRPAPEFPAIPVAAPRRVFTWPRVAWAAAAAAVVLAFLGAWYIRRPRPSYEIVSEAGKPTVGRTAIESTGHMHVGQWLETDASSRATIKVSDIGQVEVEPNTRIGLLEARDKEHRLSLQHGTLHALIWAPPGQFFVNTPSATAIDLGCAYTLEVDSQGAGMLRVSFGWVAFEKDGRESFVPAGAVCAMRPGVGPGTPYQGDAPAGFQAALAQLDFQNGAGAAALNVVLKEARPKDAFTLWHLLQRGNPSERALVYDRLAQLVPPPQGVTRDGVLSGNRSMRDLWWDALGLGDASWWRKWKGPVPGGG